MKQLIAFLCLFAFGQLGLAHDTGEAHSGDEEEKTSNLWDSRFYIWGGYMWTNHDTDLRISATDSGIGIGGQIDLEEALGLKEQVNVGRAGFRWRFAERHSIGIEGYGFGRSSTGTAAQDIPVEDFIIKAGAKTDTKLDIDIYEIEYGYSFLRDNKHDLRGLFGIYWMNIDASIKGEGNLEITDPNNPGQTIPFGGKLEGDAKVGAPLPVIGLHYGYHFARDWAFVTRFKYFAINTNDFKGRLTSLDLMVGYQTPWKLYVTGGFSTFDLGLELEQSREKYEVDWVFWGPQLTIGARF